MKMKPLRVGGAWEIVPTQHADDRGVFLEWFSQRIFADVVGHELHLGQANLSTSNVGVVRGVHVSDVPPGQSKYVTCPRGAVFDVTVDLRVGSLTFGEWDAVVLSEENRKAVYLSEGLGHAMMALTEGATIVYTCSEMYRPGSERAVNPLAPDIGIEWPIRDLQGRPLVPVLSNKDRSAPGLNLARDSGWLPHQSEVNQFRSSLTSDGGA